MYMYVDKIHCTEYHAIFDTNANRRILTPVNVLYMYRYMYMYVRTCNVQYMYIVLCSELLDVFNCQCSTT